MNHLLILASPPDHPATKDFWERLQSLFSAPDVLSVYCLHEGARSLEDSRLANQRIRLFACPRAAETMSGIGQERVTLGGPGLLAELIDRASAIQTFSPS